MSFESEFFKTSGLCTYKNETMNVHFFDTILHNDRDGVSLLLMFSIYYSCSVTSMLI